MTTHPSARFSTYSGAPSLQPSLDPSIRASHISEKSTMHHQNPPAYAAPAFNASTTTLSTDPKQAELKTWSGALERMQDERLDKQRYTMSSHKSDEVSKLALGAKVERALSRRMVGQDATFRKRREEREKMGEKRPEAVSAN